MSDFENKPQQLYHLLQDSDGTLASIARKTNSIGILSEVVQKICPDLPSNAWRLANFHEKTLVIEATSPAWGQRLQFERNKISQQLKIQTQGIVEKIDLKVVPHGRVAEKPENHPHKPAQVSAENKRYLSTQTADSLNSLAKNAPKGLKEKLEKLASHVKQ